MYKEFIIDHRIELDDLLEVFNLISSPNANEWFIEEIEASGELEELNITMKELVVETQQGAIGKKVDFIFLVSMLKCLDSLDSLLVLGGVIAIDKIDFMKPESIYSNCEYVIEFFDSTEWKFTSFNNDFIDSVIIYFNKKFPS